MTTTTGLQTITRALVALCLLLATVSWTAPARGDSAAMDGLPEEELEENLETDTRPWAEGVSVEKQQRATKLFQEGNAWLDEGLFAQAAAKYAEALKHWNHPGIRYNAALATLARNRPIEAHEHLVEAVRYGDAPLDPEKHKHALKYLNLVEQQLATIVVTCDEPGAIVRLDGNELFTAPGRYEGIVLRGEHSVTATKPGFETRQETRLFEPKGDNTVRLNLYRPEQLIERRRPWRVWGPVTVTATGALILGVAPILSLQAEDRFEDYDKTTRLHCENGCIPDEDVARLKTRGDRLNTLATVSYIAGGTAVASGIVLMVLNRKVAYRVEPEELDRRVTVAPLVGPTALGFVGTARF